MAVHNNELFIITDMDAFATLFCYSKKLRYAHVDRMPPLEGPEDAEMPFSSGEIGDHEAADRDDF